MPRGTLPEIEVPNISRRIGKVIRPHPSIRKMILKKFCKAFFWTWLVTFAFCTFMGLVQLGSQPSLRILGEHIFGGAIFGVFSGAIIGIITAPFAWDPPVESDSPTEENFEDMESTNSTEIGHSANLERGSGASSEGIKEFPEKGSSNPEEASGRGFKS